MPAVIFESHESIRVVEIGTHYRCHKRCREMGFQVRRLVRQHRIRSRVRLVKAVARKFLHQVEDARRCRLGDTAIGCAGDEYFALLRHFLRFFLTHGATQEVGAAERVPGQYLGNLHDLLLVENHAIGLFQNGF